MKYRNEACNCAVLDKRESHENINIILAYVDDLIFISNTVDLLNKHVTSTSLLYLEGQNKD